MDYDKKAAMATKHAHKVTKWTCKNCGKRQTLMMLKHDDWDRSIRVVCNYRKCFRIAYINHRQRLKV